MKYITSNIKKNKTTFKTLKYKTKLKLKIMITKDHRHYCNACHKTYPFFYDIGYEGIDIIDELQIIGAGKRKNVVCPICGSIDRSRWVQYVLENDLNIDNKRILHFAPERHISNYIKNQINENNYYSCDIVPGSADYVVDITSIPFNENYFDVVICNHVLEHIADEDQAVNELKRVVVPGGKILLSVPYSLKLEHTIEDTSSDLTDDDRLVKFGQEDHVRVHGKDFKEYLESFGLKVKVYVVDEILSKAQIERMALISKDRVFVCEKPHD